jgi:hypothetical protein
MCTIEPILLPIVDVEDCGAFDTMFSKVLDELKEGGNTHPVVSRAGCGGYRIVVGREENAALLAVLRLGPFDLHENICAFEIDTVL